MTLSVKKYQFQGNEPILLNDPSKVWVIHSGSMALFATKVQDGVLMGIRRYLFTLREGQIVFGSTNQQYQMLAVPIEEVQLSLYNRQSLSGLITNTNNVVIPWIENWLNQLGNIISDLAPPNSVKALQQNEFSLNKAEIFQTVGNTIYWVKIKQGTVRYLGFNELILNNTTQIFPICSSTWLEAVDEVQLTIVETSALSADDIIEGFTFLHEQLLHLVPILNDLEAQEESQRLELRQQLNDQMITKAFIELASPLNPQQVEEFSDDKPLLVAAGAVGKAMGVKICPIANSENLQYLKDPLEAIARASRLRLRRVVLRNNWWENDCGPLIAYITSSNTNNERPVALLPTSATSYELFDPVEQKRQKVSESVAATLTPFAHMLYRSLPDKIITASDLLRFTLKGQQRDILTIVFTGISVMLLGLLTPGATAVIIDKVIINHESSLLTQIGIGLFVAAIATALLLLTQGLALLRIEAATDVVTQAAVWDRLLKEPVSFFRQYTVGDLQSRVFSISTIRRQLSGRVLINLVSSFFSLFFFGQLLCYSLPLALIALAVAIITFIFTTFFGVILLKRSRPLLECQGELFGHTVQLINGISKLHIAGAEDRAFATWSKNYSQQIKLEGKKRRVEEVIIIFNTVMPTLTNIILFLCVINLFPSNPTSTGFTLGAFIAFNTAFHSFLQGSASLSNTFTDILQIIPLWKRTQPILETVPEVSLKKADPGKLTGKITINQLTFRYRSDGVLTLNDINICAQPGEFIALVGGSGSGKSTLLRLLLGFENYESGSICYDNQDLSGLDIDAVRRQMGVVLQNTQLQAASIYENIGGGATITLEEAWEAAKASGFADDIMAMPMQMHTVISEGGTNLSGGQRQRLVIARALALKPRILLFDEATSALDNKTQAIVSEYLEKLRVTRIVIAHRLSTIRNADRIYVLQQGRVVQQGNFDELTSQPGLFTQLMARQNL